MTRRSVIESEKEYTYCLRVLLKWVGILRFLSKVVVVILNCPAIVKIEVATTKFRNGAKEFRRVCAKVRSKPYELDQNELVA
jgi:hypothetical protein